MIALNRMVRARQLSVSCASISRCSDTRLAEGITAKISHCSGVAPDMTTGATWGRQISGLGRTEHLGNFGYAVAGRDGKEDLEMLGFPRPECADFTIAFCCR